MGQSIVIEYDSKWPQHFEALSEVLRQALGDHARHIHHVGSTSIPGMLAKPIIDIDVELVPGVPVEYATAVLGSIGYEFEGDRGIRDRYAYKNVSVAVPFSEHRDVWPDHHLYVCPHNSLELARHLLFRDRLRSSSELRDAYVEIKREALRRSGGVRQVYVEEKERLGDAFFRKVIGG